MKEVKAKVDEEIVNTQLSNEEKLIQWLGAMVFIGLLLLLIFSLIAPILSAS